MDTYTLKVVDKRIETEDTVTLCFKQPALRKIRYKSGQYLTLMFRINGRRYVRPYSFSSSPVVDTLMEVTVKRVPNGIVSNHIHDRVQIGDAVEVMQPMGDFIFDPEEKGIDSVYFWGAGSGITPLISLAKDILTSNNRTSVHLIYGNRNSETTIFMGVIDSLLKVYPQRFKVWHFHTQLTLRDSNPFVVEGRINKDYALNIVSKTGAINTKHYICGPVGLKESVRDALVSLKVPSANILSEDFELVRNPEDFNDIHTQVVRLKFQHEEHVLEVIKGKSVLEAALDAGIELPYSCQTGNCSTCKATCLDGKLKTIGLGKERSDLAENEYLLCCSHPLTDKVLLEV